MIVKSLETGDVHFVAGMDEDSYFIFFDCGKYSHLQWWLKTDYEIVDPTDSYYTPPGESFHSSEQVTRSTVQIYLITISQKQPSNFLIR
ncbi:hypothetical protein [Chitinophaga sp. S165]|uniref:hypothetical protein n=1 Tax=Chitinophaga sp. S165 TaxID=2135462 RepID=UPI000D713D34|nr:hypothetical protein [Chitinophaga sp. S165]PWV49130.1 hypothetical protein C7475_106376 [Chitinophaga sp. S165]